MPARLAYILAASHSGSTLLAMLLGAHADACTVGELTLYPHAMGDADHYTCSCGQPIRQCAFWRRVGEAMARRGTTFDIGNAGTGLPLEASPYVRRLLAPLHHGRVLEAVRDAALALSPAWRKGLAASQRRVGQLAASLQEITGASVVVDSSKTALRLKYLLRNPDLDIQVIRLIRDGRGVAVTYTDPGALADAADPALRGGGRGRAGEQARPIDEAAREWRRCNEASEHVLARLDQSRWTTVTYEQLCANPDETLRTLCRFLDLDPAKLSRDFRQADQHVVGNGMRLDTQSAIRLDERWKTLLSRDDLRTFETIAGDLNRRYAYS